jgi:hypothetical protein
MASSQSARPRPNSSDSERPQTVVAAHAKGTGELTASLNSARNCAESVVRSGAAAFATTPDSWCAWRLSHVDARWVVEGPAAEELDLERVFDLRVFTTSGEFRWRKEGSSGRWSITWFSGAAESDLQSGACDVAECEEMTRSYRCGPVNLSGEVSHRRDGMDQRTDGFWVETELSGLTVWVDQPASSNGPVPDGKPQLVLCASELVPVDDMNATVVDEVLTGFSLKEEETG